jgi:hypothetical protein
MSKSYKMQQSIEQKDQELLSESSNERNKRIRVEIKKTTTLQVVDLDSSRDRSKLDKFRLKINPLTTNQKEEDSIDNSSN